MAKKKSAKAGASAKAQGKANHESGANPTLDRQGWKALPPALAPLVALPNWVVWRLETTKQGKPTKVPYRPQNPKLKASTDKPETWDSYNVAVAAAQAGNFDGIGFVLTDTEFTAFDIDDCRDPATGAIHPWAQEKVTRANSYTEITTSDTGLRIIGMGTGKYVHSKRPVVDGVTCELYRRAIRYIVMTGNQFNGAGLINIDDAIDETVAELEKKPKKKEPTKGTKKELPQELRIMLYAQGDSPAGYPSRSELF
jgi:primase-polymerase (primpol)-like protein